ncbi:hypothetical protein [Dulcicalothrix desertica]|uniref:hypothetical protein n=1 Tax=Dulcicalothrix desertica TaxID=32056 RepID=UPI000F8D4A79|nr:hypothetical protein [Dulcicalothrix desertica]
MAPDVKAFGNNYTFKLPATEVCTHGTPALKNELTFNINVIAANNARQTSYMNKNQYHRTCSLNGCNR